MIYSTTVRAFFGGLIAAGVAFSALPAAAGPWRKIESRSLVIYSNNEEKMVRDYARHMEGFNLAADRLLEDIGDSKLDASGKQTFYYMSSLPEFKTVKPSIPDYAFNPELFCDDYGRSFFSVMEQFNYDTVDKKFISADLAYLMRSYTSIKIAEHFSVAPPAWVQVGLQDYFMTMNIDNGKAIVGIPLPDLVLNSNSGGVVSFSAFYPIDKILDGSALAEKDKDVARFQQWMLISHLLTTAERREQLARYLEKVRDGADKVTAFRDITGIDDAAMKALYQEYNRKGVAYLTYPLEEQPESETSAVKLPSYGRDVPLMLASLRTCPPRKHGERLLTDLRKLAVKFPEDAVVSEATALAEIDFGDPSSAQPYLEKRLVASPQDDEALLQKGRMTLALATRAEGEARKTRFADARKLFGAAYKLNPTNPQILYGFALAHQDQATYPNANVINAVELAQSYSAGGYKLYLAELYARTGRYEDSLAQLTPWADTIDDKDCRAIMGRIITALNARAPAAELVPLFKLYTDTDEEA